MTKGILIEAAVDTAEAARAAVAAGADRLELCAELDAGGLTPPPDLLAQLRADVPVPIFAMVRPRGGDFVYSARERATMIDQAREMRRLGAAGLVLGGLRPDGSIDEGLLETLLAAARPLPVTFHRAIDRTAEPLAALEVLIRHRVDRVLTSGGAPSAESGIPMLAAMVERATGRITVLPGGGVNGHNVMRIIRGTGAREIHARCGDDGERIRGIVSGLV